MLHARGASLVHLHSPLVRLQEEDSCLYASFVERQDPRRILEVVSWLLDRLDELPRREVFGLGYLRHRWWKLRWRARQLMLCR
jgi:hypothetical protein